LKSRQLRQFKFGRNWKAFSERALTIAKVEEARKDFAELFRGLDLRGRSFLDIGFGQGLTLLIAASSGARAVGCDIDPLCAEVIRENQAHYFAGLSARTPSILVGSILDDIFVAKLRTMSGHPAREGYDLVHAWGVLHHSGNMACAIRNAAALVTPGGHLVIAIYNRHWTSPAWKGIKWLYNNSPFLIQRLLLKFFYPVIYLAKLLVTRQDPRKQTRGMDFYYDLVDWIGGYPYEYATVEEIKALVESFEFRLQRLIPASVPTGCNQFVFAKQTAFAATHSSRGAIN
jgi:SAM-dependent methyltransferase